MLVDRYINIMLDIVMHILPKETIPAHGSSCSMGGSTCGHAIGNTFNIADAREVWSDFNYLDGEPTKGKIYLYISDLNPVIGHSVTCIIFFDRKYRVIKPSCSSAESKV